MTDLETRSVELEYREEPGAEEGFVEGYAVRWGEIADIGGRYKETFQRGAFTGSEDVKLYRDHRELIGHVVESEDREEGFWIRAKVALTSLGKDTLALLRSGALNRFSVGFMPKAKEERNGVLVRTAALLREVSVVERPAYAGAHVLAVREESNDRTSVTNHKEESAMTDSVDVDLTEVRAEIEELRQDLSLLPEKLTYKAAPQVDTRSAAAAVMALARGDEAVTSTYNTIAAQVRGDEEAEALHRAYTGGTTADAPLQNQWVGDLTRIFDASSSILADTFAKGTLPAKGNVLEYAQLGSVSGTVQEQVNEGDDLAYMNVTLTTKTAEVHTYGGRTQLSFQAIERSTLPLLQRNLEYMAVQAGVNKKVVLRADYDALVAARRAISSNGGVIVGGAAVGSMTAAQWASTVLKANARFKAQGYTAQKLIVTSDVFESLLNLTTTGDRVLQIVASGNGNAAGSLSVSGLTATLFGIPVEVDDSPSSGASTAQAVFVNGAAIRTYDSALVSLQDSNIINLTKDFSVYRYGAIADEQPNLIVPVKFAAS